LLATGERVGAVELQGRALFTTIELPRRAGGCRAAAMLQDAAEIVVVQE